jgi:uncharacterized membrane protein
VPEEIPDDEGQILVMLIAYVLLTLLMITVLVDITAVHLERARLFALSDATALDAADALDRARFYGSTRTVADVPLSDQTVKDSAEAYLSQADPPHGITAVAISDPSGSPDGSTARVTLIGRAHLPLLSFVVSAWSGGVPLHATSQARARTVP